MNKLPYNMISRRGRRDNNEDSFLVTTYGNTFIVCDGVGGNAKGEVASKLCCTSFENFFNKEHIVFPEAGQIEEALRYTEQCFSEFTYQHPASSGMGTTLTFLSVDANKAVVAHAGDSRVYHIRNGEILFVTTDHSLVGELVSSGYITKEEALHHPRKNEINRAILGTDRPTTVDIARINDTQPGDYFLLCTDGVLESVSEKIMGEIFRNNNAVDVIIREIDEACANNSADNYTALVVRIMPSAEKQEVMAGGISQNLKPRRIARYWSLLIIFMVTVITFLFYMGGKRDRPVENERLPATNSEDSALMHKSPLEKGDSATNAKDVKLHVEINPKNRHNEDTVKATPHHKQYPVSAKKLLPGIKSPDSNSIKKVPIDTSKIKIVVATVSKAKENSNNPTN